MITGDKRAHRLSCCAAIAFLQCFYYRHLRFCRVLVLKYRHLLRFKPKNIVFLSRWPWLQATTRSPRVMLRGSCAFAAPPPRSFSPTASPTAATAAATAAAAGCGKVLTRVCSCHSGVPTLWLRSSGETFSAATTCVSQVSCHKHGSRQCSESGSGIILIHFSGTWIDDLPTYLKKFVVDFFLMVKFVVHHGILNSPLWSFKSLFVILGLVNPSLRGLSRMIFRTRIINFRTTQHGKKYCKLVEAFVLSHAMLWSELCIRGWRVPLVLIHGKISVLWIRTRIDFGRIDPDPSE